MVSLDYRILVVHRDAVEAGRLVDELEGLGYLARAVPDPSAAASLEIVDTWSPDRILLDLQLPHLDGWRFLEDHRRQLGYRAPVIAYAERSELARTALDAGAAAFLPAPFLTTQLLRTMAQVR